MLLFLEFQGICEIVADASAFGYVIVSMIGHYKNMCLFSLIFVQNFVCWLNNYDHSYSMIIELDVTLQYTITVFMANMSMC